MVATRRGVTVSTPMKVNPDQSADVPATPSTSRRTRRTVGEKRAESPTQSLPEETSSQLEKNKGPLNPSPPTSLLKRCTRAARLHSPEQTCTPVEMSDVDSVCSVMSDAELPMTRTRGRRRLQPQLVSQEDDDVSEVESCSSAVSNTGVRRSTRRKVIPRRLVEVGDSVSQRVTRSLRKTARDRSSAMRQTEDVELSDADSFVSSVSGAETSKSTARRATTSRRQTGPIPAYLDETSDAPQSPASRARLSRAAKASAAAAANVEYQSCDSEGFESGPHYSRRTRGQRKTESTRPGNVDSDSETTDSRSQTGTTSHMTRATRRSLMDCSIILDKAEVSSINDATLESTAILEEADCTLVEANQTLEEGRICTDLTPTEAAATSAEGGVILVSEDESSNVTLKISDSPARAAEALIKPAVTDGHQQEEPCALNGDWEVSEKMTMQDAIQPVKTGKPLQSATVTLCESAFVIPEETEEMDEAMEVADAEARAPQGDEVAVKTGPSEEENPAGSNTAQVESIQVPSSQRRSITVDSDPGRKPKDVVVVENTKIISLLDSDEDEESEDEEVDGSWEEEEERARASHKCGAAAASSSCGLFMIDTRPGQEVDEQYYEKPTEVEQEGQDEEFVDEEGGDDDDEDAQFLFSSRNPLLKGMSSRIDPGIRLKELGGLYISLDGSQSKPVSSSLRKRKVPDVVMKKSVMGPDFEKKDAVPPYSESKNAVKLKNRTEREKSTGDGWFNMKAPEMTKELKMDLKVLKMRGSLDPKRFYKKNDRDGFPKYFQVGTVEDSPVDFYHSRLPKKQRKRTMVEELLADAQFRQSNKLKYQHIMMERAAQGGGKKRNNNNKKKNKSRKK
ncbi:deoxynucleotidyltransferase terminal-interacting protein 2 [Gasterosteus aculeatus]